MDRCLWEVVFWVTSPGLRPSRAITTTCPAPGRGTLGKASMVLFDGEGVPSPAPPLVVPPRSSVWVDAGERHVQYPLSRTCFSGDITCTAPVPTGGGGARSAGGVGEKGEQCMGRCLWERVFWVTSPGLRLSRTLTTKAPARECGDPGEGSVRFSSAGRG